MELMSQVRSLECADTKMSKILGPMKDTANYNRKVRKSAEYLRIFLFHTEV